MYSKMFNDLQGIADPQYLEPKTIKEACNLMAQYKPKAAVTAGGAKLLAAIRNKEIAPEFLISLKSIPNLETIAYSDTEGLKIGALATLDAIDNSSIIKERFAILAKAIHEARVASPQARWQYYLSTLGGSLCGAKLPFGIAPVLAVLDARFTVEGIKGWRAASFEQFYPASGRNAASDNFEILSGIRLTAIPVNSGAAYMSKPGKDAVPGLYVASVLTLDQKKVNITNLRLALGIEGKTTYRAINAEAGIKNKPIDEQIVKKTAQTAAEESAGMAGVADAAAYQKIVRDLVEQSITQVMDDAIGDFAMGY